MGTLGKRLGQLAARSFESESSNIIKTIAANKKPGSLSKALDTTLRTSHDMKIFGLGTAASMSSLGRYKRFTTSMHAVYVAMEESMDNTKSHAVQHTWSEFAHELRRGPALRSDLEEAHHLLEIDLATPDISPATQAYVSAIRQAQEHDDATGGARLLGHLYCRYFADLFGGQALAKPYQWALGLGPSSPRHYDFGEFGANRRASIERIYESLNEAGELLAPEQREAVVEECKVAFRNNILVYKEDGRLMLDGTTGIARMLGGFARSRMA